MAERFRGCVRATDTAARLGGDEFAVLIEDVDDEHDAEWSPNNCSTRSRSHSDCRTASLRRASIGIAHGRAARGQ